MKTILIGFIIVQVFALHIVFLVDKTKVGCQKRFGRRISDLPHRLFSSAFLINIDSIGSLGSLIRLLSLSTTLKQRVMTKTASGSSS